MKIIKFAKRALGLEEDSMTEDWNEGGGTTESVERPQRQPMSLSATEPTIDPSMVHAIFGRVVEVFNASLPDFLQKSADPEKQKRYLYDSLDASLKEYLDALASSSQQACQKAWEGDQQQMRQQMEALQKRAAELEEKRGQLTERQLSADRQKRALAERVRDLEEQVMALESEKEQYQLEAQSLLNKIKVSDVRKNDFEALEAELKRLREQKGQAEDPETQQKVVELQQKLEESDKKNAQLTAEISKMAEAVEAAKVKAQMCDQMVSEMHAKVNEKQVQLDAANAKAEALLAAEAKVQELENHVLELEVKLEEANGKVGDETVTPEEMQQVMDQVSRFEEVKQKMNSRIETLKESLNTAQKQMESLRHTIKTNLMEHARAEKALKDEIEALKARNAIDMTTDIDVVDAEAGESPVEADVEVDDFLSGEDWLVSTPPKESSMRPPVDESDFGYQPPQKKQRAAENKSQLSLFD